MVKSWFLAILLLVGLVTWPSPLVMAEGPNYALPGEFALPWACGQGYRVSWEPHDHWQHGKATGIAYDFAMPVGTPLYAPVGGTAYFMVDERPLETNLGNYVELVDDTGQWIVRLAHLRDAQQGRRRVQAGELIGYSGASGVASAHLHLELLVRSGDRWIRPDPERLPRLYGLPRGDLVMGSIVVNLACPAELAMDGEITPWHAPVQLGEGVDLLAPVFNQGLEPLHVTLAQISLYSASGDSMIAQAQGDWYVDAQSGITLTIPAYLPAAGLWYVGRLTYHTDQGARGVPARGQVLVIPSPLRPVGLSVGPGDLAMGDLLQLTLWVENQGMQPVSVDGFFVEGLRPDGAHWRIAHDGPLALAPGEMLRLSLEGDFRLQQVGSWTLQRFGYLWEGHAYQVAGLQRELIVSGPQLIVERLELYRSPDVAHLFLQVRNIGTAPAEAEAVEIWGWAPSGESFAEHIRPAAPLEPGQTALLQLDVAVGETQGLWRLVEAGYWMQGIWYPMALPMQPSIQVDTWANEAVDAMAPVGGPGQIRPRLVDRPLPE